MTSEKEEGKKAEYKKTTKGRSTGGDELEDAFGGANLKHSVGHNTQIQALRHTTSIGERKQAL
jgi:hypothetical protein